MGLVHAAHTATARHSATTACSCALLVVFFDVGHQSFGGEHQAGDGSGVLQSETRNLGWIDYASLNQVTILAGVGVEAEVVVFRFADAANHHSAFVSGVVNDLAHGLFESALHDVDANGFVIVQLELFECRDAATQRSAAAGNNAFLDSRACGVHGVLHTSLLFLQLGLGCCPHFNYGDAAYQLGQTLLQLFAVVIRRGVFHLRANLANAAFDLAGFPAAFNDRGVVLVDGDFLGAAEIFHLHVLELDAEIFSDSLAARQRSDVFQHGLATVAEA